MNREVMKHLINDLERELNNLRSTEKNKNCALKIKAILKRMKEELN